MASAAIRSAPAKSILSPTTGFIAAAGFTHSLTPARNCTFGCTYCYVPTMRVQGGLQPEDWQRWGQFTTFKENAPDLLLRQLRPNQKIYCSPLTDPYQPAEAEAQRMPAILDALMAKPPRLICLQTRGPLVKRDLTLLAGLAARCQLRISFSLTTNREDVRRRYEPHCATFEDRLEAMRALRSAGLRVFATIAPILPCDPEVLLDAVLDIAEPRILGDPFHSRVNKPSGATTRPESLRVSGHHGWLDWHEPAFQQQLADQFRVAAAARGREFAIGPAAFSWLAQEP
jgi:DNA repair photolyase